MGGADIIPGVSGGTMALILGIYERLVRAISHVDTQLLGHLRRGRFSEAAAHVDLRFLLTLGCGILLGIGGLATLMNYLIQYHPQQTLAVFFGLILASSLLVGRMVERWNVAAALLALAGATFAFWLVARPKTAGWEGDGYLFLCGMVAICAMILPGISGAFILLIMGKYDHMTGVIARLVHGEATLQHVLTLGVFAAGCVVGLLSFSKILRWLLGHYHTQTMAILCGFMVGSLRRLWPLKDIPPGEVIDFKHSQYTNVLPDRLDGQVMLIVGLAAAAMVFVLLLDRCSRKHHQASAREK